MKKSGVKRGKEKRRKKRTKRRESKEEVTVCFLCSFLKSSVKEGDLESCGGLSWSDFLEKPEDLSDGESDTRVEVRAVLDVIDVFVSLSSVGKSRSNVGRRIHGRSTSRDK